jgi:ankyrin repeat protein
MRFGAETRAQIETLLRDDDVEGLRALLDSGLPPLANDKTLATPVSLAAQSGARNCVRLLLEKGGSPDAGDPPPLVGAILGGHYEVLDLLLAAGADPGSQPYDEEEEPPLVVAAERGDARAIRALAAAGAVAVSAPGFLKEALRRALEVKGAKGDEALATLLADALPRLERESVDADAELTKAARRLGKKSASAESKDIARRAKAIANEAKAEIDEAVNSVLEERLSDLFELLARVPEERRKKLAGMAAIYAAGGPAALVESLLQKAGPADVRDDQGRTALMYAVLRCSDLLVDALLMTGQAGVAQRDDEGYTALDLLSKREQEAGGSTTELSRDLERWRGNEASAKRRPARDAVRIGEAPGSAKQAAELVRKRQHGDLFRLLSQLPREEARLAAGAALLEECRAGGWTLLEALLDLGADVNVLCDRNSNVLMAAVSTGVPLRIIERLVRLGSDPTGVDCWGRNVLDEARRSREPGDPVFALLEEAIARRAE